VFAATDGSKILHYQPRGCIPQQQSEQSEDLYVSTMGWHDVQIAVLGQCAKPCWSALYQRGTPIRAQDYDN
jgi:hypothetical protein